MTIPSIWISSHCVTGDIRARVDQFAARNKGETDLDRPSITTFAAVVG